MIKKLYQPSLGDLGITSLCDNKKISKTSPSIETLGCLDELSAYLQLILTKKIHQVSRDIINTIIKSLFAISGAIAQNRDLVLQNEIKNIEQSIEHLQKQLLPINQFLTFSDNENTALLNISRTLCRKTERRFFAMNNSITDIGAYLNRLSGLLFLLGFTEKR